MGLLDGELRETVGSALDFLMGDVVLSRMVGGEHNPTTGKTTGAHPVQYTGRGRTLDYSDFSRAMGAVTEKDRKLLLMQKDFGTTPQQGDTITVVADGETYHVIQVKADPANATWEIQVRL